MTGPFQEPKSFTAVACGTERIVLKRQAILDAGRQREINRMVEMWGAVIFALVVFALFMGPLFYWRFGVQAWELMKW